MASRKTLLVAAAMVLVAATALLPVTASKKKTFTVGDDAGWDLGVDYKAWARGKKFHVGDTIVFKPKSAELDVVLVNEQSFKDCVSPHNATVLSSHGKPVAGKLGGAGRFFFISDAEGACESGLKLTINVKK